MDVRVLAVDDQDVFLRTARDLIAATPGFRQVGEALSGAEALDRAADLHPDLVLLDVRMPGMDGIETCRRLADVSPSSVVVLTSVESVANLPRVPGAIGHIRKQDLSPETLLEVWSAPSARR